MQGQCYPDRLWDLCEREPIHSLQTPDTPTSKPYITNTFEVVLYKHMEHALLLNSNSISQYMFCLLQSWKRVCVCLIYIHIGTLLKFCWAYQIKYLLVLQLKYSLKMKTFHKKKKNFSLYVAGVSEEAALAGRGLSLTYHPLVLRAVCPLTKLSKYAANLNHVWANWKHRFKTGHLLVHAVTSPQGFTEPTQVCQRDGRVGWLNECVSTTFLFLSFSLSIGPSLCIWPSL